MEVVKLYWFKHNCKDGQYSSAKVHRSLKVSLKQENSVPSCAEDYEITLESLDGLAAEIVDGL
jgi:CRISPR-associated protein Csd2